MQKGQIRVQTENIFPIIKKFLYSDHEIFLRELVSNAIDACQKLNVLKISDAVKVSDSPFRIDVILNKNEKTITIKDNGIGMTEMELDKYINQVAFSGAEEFVNKYKDASIIGHFGLGFYSSFMVSDKVEIFSKSYKNESGVFWSCDGSTNYELYQVDYSEFGTKIVLHINVDSEEFLESYRLKSILEKFCKFLPIPIFFKEEGIIEKKEEPTSEEPTDIAEVIEEIKDENKSSDEEISLHEDDKVASEDDSSEPESKETPINDTNPIWIRKPADLKKEDYENFYRKLYPMGETPLFWIHLNVDYPFKLTGVLYFPKIKQSYEIQKDKIQLYCNQVFVTDEVKEIVPEFLMLLHGIIDSPDIPLNVSRSYLQGDPNVKKINAHITKKVADKLEEIFNNERNEFENKWESLGLFVKYGMMTDDKFLDKANKFLIFPDTSATKKITKIEGEQELEKEVTVFYTIEEYKNVVQEKQKNKNGKIVMLYSTDPVQQDNFIKKCKEKEYVVVKMDTIVDAAFINNIEMKWNDVQFVRVDSDIVENLIDKQENKDSVLSKEEVEKLKELFKAENVDLNLSVNVVGLSPEATPITATRPEFMRRMKDMASIGGGMASFYASMKDEVEINLNGNHPIFNKIISETDSIKQKTTIRNLLDLSLLSQGLLKGAALSNYIERNLNHSAL
ncbi:MAG: molecular chaperone HtpG [Sediminibacterium sp.]|nr:molecular chaperone HtpG [Sediminibacterium sp.]